MRSIIIVCFMIIALSSVAYTFSSYKVSELPELATTPADSDELFINDGGVSKKIQYINLTGNKLNISDITKTTAADDSGAYLIGVYDEFDNSASANVQDVLDDFDALLQVGVDEAYSSGWNADTDSPEKDDVYDYLHQIDADDDGSLIDESWFNLYNVGNPSTSKIFDIASYTLAWTLGSNGHHKLGGDADDYFEIYEDGSGNFIFQIVDAGSDGNIYVNLGTFTITDEAIAIQTGIGSDDYFTLAGYDEDGTAYQELMRLTNANDPFITVGSSTNNIWISAAGIQTINGAVNFSNSEVTDGHFSTLIHKTWSFDPDAVCDGDVDRLFLMTVGDEAASGIIIDEWKVSFEADPTTEADLDLKYADAFIGVANAAVIDVLDTTNGVASEDTDANINSGNAVANGKVMYLEFGTAYTETGHQIIVELWYHAD